MTDADDSHEDCRSCGASYTLAFTTDKTDCHRCGVRLLCPDKVRAAAHQAPEDTSGIEAA